MLCRRVCLLPRWMLGRLWIHDGCFAAIGSLADALLPKSLASSLVNVLLPRVCWPSSWRMLYRRGHSVFVGRCFDAVAAGCRFSGQMLCQHGLVYCVGNHCVVVSFFLQAQLVGVGLWRLSLSSFFFLVFMFIPGPKPLPLWFVICATRDSLVVVSCNLLCLMKNGLYSRIAKKYWGLKATHMQDQPRHPYTSTCTCATVVLL
jgi:hypothetical protein